MPEPGFIPENPDAQAEASFAAAAEMGQLQPPEDDYEPSDHVPELPDDLRDIPDNLQSEATPTDEENVTHLAEALEHAGTDAVTGLPNRQAFVKDFEQKYGFSLDRPASEHDQERRQHSVKPRRAVVIYADICDLKKTNDTFGHDTGDKQLKQVADMLASKIRPGDLIARVGGDEFVIILDLPDDPPPTDLEAFRQDRLNAFTEAGFSNPRTEKFQDYTSAADVPTVVAFGASIGEVRPLTADERYAKGGDAPPTTFTYLSRQADEAMYSHKKALKAQSPDGPEPERRTPPLL